MKLTDNDRNLIAFVATLAAVLVLSKTGSPDVATMTALVAVLAALGQNFRKSIPPEKDKQP